MSELAMMGKPAVLVPSPNVTNNHQERNARVLERAGGAIVLPEPGLTSETMSQTVLGLIHDRKRLDLMECAMRSYGVPDATERITDVVLGLAAKS